MTTSVYDFADITQRITIADILRDHGVELKGNRCRCPIHDGENPTSFSFNEETFNCFACGAKGGLIDLVQRLRNCGRREAIRYLEDSTGIRLTDSSGFHPKLPSKRKLTAEIVARRILKFKIDSLRQIHGCLTRELRARRKLIEIGSIPLAEYYADRQKLEYRLECLDEKIIRLTQELHSLPRRAG